MINFDYNPPKNIKFGDSIFQLNILCTLHYSTCAIHVLAPVQSTGAIAQLKKYFREELGL